MRASRKVCVGLTGITAVLGAGSVSWACTVPVGFTWYADGTYAKSGPNGTLVTAYGTGARASRTYFLVTGDNSVSGHDGHPCMDNVRNINPNPRRSNTAGFIANTAGFVNAPTPGDWQVCFREPDGSTATTPVSFTAV